MNKEIEYDEKYIIKPTVGREFLTSSEALKKMLVENHYPIDSKYLKGHPDSRRTELIKPSAEALAEFAIDGRKMHTTSARLVNEDIGVAQTTQDASEYAWLKQHEAGMNN